MRTQSILLLASLAASTACAPAPASDADNASSLIKLAPNAAQPSGVTLSAAHPTYSLAFTCPALAGYSCIITFDYGLAESSVIAQKAQVPQQPLTTSDGTLFTTRSLFFDAIDGDKLFDYGWTDPLDARGAPSFNDSEEGLVSPGDHVLVLTREPSLPAGFSDLHLHITMQSRIVCDGDSCAPSGSTPDGSTGAQSATVIGTLQSSSAVDGQPVALAGADVILHAADGSSARDQETTAAGDGSFSFVGVALGSYTLLVDSYIVQAVQVTQGGLVDLGTIID